MLINALGKIQVLGIDANITAQEAADGLYDLNSMLDAWGIEKLMVYQVQQSSYSWAASAGSKTIGSGGDFDTTRPTRIEPAGNFFRTSGSLDYPLAVYPREQYDRIVQKTTGGSIPEFLFYDDGFPTRTLYAYPIPSETLTLYLNTWKPLQSFSGLTTTISLPPGYQAAIEWNLAIWTAPRYGKSAVESAKGLKEMAALLKSNIKNVNYKAIVSSLDAGLVGGGRRSRIESDT